MRDPIEDFAARRGFYFRDNYRRLVIVALVLQVICSLLVGWIAYDLKTERPSRFFVTTQSGELIPLVAADSASRAVVGRPIVVQNDY